MGAYLDPETSKECPFCGGEANYMNFRYTNDNETCFAWVECLLCGGRTKTFTVEEENFYEPLKSRACRSAFEAWNKRTEE